MTDSSPRARSPSVAVEDPFAIADNARPLTLVRLGNQALATSGGGRRGWRIAGRWYGHVLDPWTAGPIPERASGACVAATTGAADAAASAAVVLDGVALSSLADREGLAVLRVAEDGAVWRSARWLATVDERSAAGDDGL